MRGEGWGGSDCKGVTQVFLGCDGRVVHPDRVVVTQICMCDSLSQNHIVKKNKCMKKSGGILIRCVVELMILYQCQFFLLDNILLPNKVAVIPISSRCDVEDEAAPLLFLATSHSDIILISAHWPTPFQYILLVGEREIPPYRFLATAGCPTIPFS